MIKVDFDKFDEASGDSTFVAEMQAVPRKGEGLWIERSMIPDHYEQYLAQYHEAEDMIPVTVRGVYHRVTKAGHVIQVDFDFD